MPRSSLGSAAQLVATGVGFAHGARRILSDVSLTLADRDRVGIVGANGSGKSTLLGLLAGRLVPDAGQVLGHPPDVTVGLLAQSLTDRPDDTIGSFLARTTGVAQVVASFEEAAQELSGGLAGAEDRYDRALTRYLDTDAATFDDRLDQTLDQVGLGVDPGRLTRELSGGQRARVGLAAVLLAAFDVVLLDEPTNDLDLAGIELVERYVAESAAPMAIVSHDRAFLAAVATSIVEIDAPSATAIRFDGGFDAWLVERERAIDRHRERYEQYQAKRSELAERAQRQRQWSNQGVSRARKDRSEPDKHVRNYRIATSERVAAQAKQTARALERLEHDEAVDAPWKPWELRLRFGEADRCGHDVAVADGAVLRRGEFVLGPIDVAVEAGDRILLTGDNGSGKTSLLELLFGGLEPSAGVVRLGPAVEVGLLAQHRPLFAEAEALVEAFGAAAGCDDQAARSHLAKLGLDHERLGRPVATLSLGERTRAALGSFAARGVNLLVVDEPTNHLDLPAIEALEAALEVYPHTLVLVSHDRRLIESVTTTRRWRLTDEPDFPATLHQS